MYFELVRVASTRLKEDPKTLKVKKFKKERYLLWQSSMRIFGVIHFLSYKATLKQQLSLEKWDVRRWCLGQPEANDYPTIPQG